MDVLKEHPLPWKLVPAGTLSIRQAGYWALIDGLGHPIARRLSCKKDVCDFIIQTVNALHKKKE